MRPRPSSFTMVITAFHSDLKAISIARRLSLASSRVASISSQRCLLDFACGDSIRKGHYHQYYESVYLDQVAGRKKVPLSEAESNWETNNCQNEEYDLGPIVRPDTQDQVSDFIDHRL